MGNLGTDVKKSVADIHRGQLADDIGTAHEDHFTQDRLPSGSLPSMPTDARGQLLEDLSVQYMPAPEDVSEARNRG